MYAIILSLTIGLGFPLAVFAAESKPKPDTAGKYLRQVWAAARRKYRDANLLSISGNTHMHGVVRCHKVNPFQDGWRYTFFSRSANQVIMMASCQGKFAGPLRQLRSRSGDTSLSIRGSFIDSDMAIEAMKRAGYDIDPAKYGVGGKRPFNMRLHRIEDKRFPEHPAVWTIKVGKRRFVIDAVKNKRFNPDDYGVDLSVRFSSSTPLVSKAISQRPKRDKVYTVKRDLERIKAYANKNYPGSTLMAIEGFVDAWGSTPCVGSGDGWSYVFYWPTSRQFESVFACNGYIGPGPQGRVPVDMMKHDAIAEPFIDSDRLIDSVLFHDGGAMSEGMGRSYSRKGTARLRRHRSAPFQGVGLSQVRQIWEVTIGRTLYLFDARSGKFLQARQL